MTSSPGYAKPLVCEPRHSRAALTLLTAAYGASAIALLWLPPMAALMAAPVLAAGGMFEWRRWGRQPSRLEWRADGAWSIFGDGHDGTTAWLAVGTFCSPWLVVLTLVDERRVYRRVLVRDAVDAVAWRRLRMRLRQYPATALADVATVRGLRWWAARGRKRLLWQVPMRLLLAAQAAAGSGAHHGLKSRR